MTRLSPELATAIEHARSVSDPSSENHERVRAALLARLGSPAFHAPAPPAQGQTEIESRVRFGRRWRLGVLAGAVCAIGVAILLKGPVAGSPESDGDAVHRVEPTSAVVSPNAVFLTPTWPETRDETSPSAMPVARTKKVAPATEKPSLPLPTGRTSSGVADELPILLRAHAALDAHDPQAALVALDEHARRFPNGVLAEERASEHVVALCAAGRTAEAHAERERFLKEHPHSPGAARVQGACADDGAGAP